jgi:hypothetical protein
MKRAGAVCVASIFAVVLSACGGGGGSGGAGAVPGGSQAAPLFPLPAPGPARSYAGTRTVSVSGTPLPTWPGAGTYTVAESDQILAPPSGAPSGTTVVAHITRNFTGPQPARGILPAFETLDADLASTNAGIVVLATTDTTIGNDVGAASTFNGPAGDTVTRSITYPPNALLVPASFVGDGTGVALPLASTMHLTDHDVAPAGATARDLDYTRTTNADGSFDETGTDQGIAMHAMHQPADGSSSSHDQLPGFFLRDVTVSARGASQTLSVTTATQGRTVGNPPVVTTTYSTPVWYAPYALASATAAEDGGPLVFPPSCGQPSTARASALLVIHRTHVDVAAGLVVQDDDETYTDATNTAVCRSFTENAFVYDVTTGAQTGTLQDVSVVHLTTDAAGAGVTATSKRRETR